MACDGEQSRETDCLGVLYGVGVKHTSGPKGRVGLVAFNAGDKSPAYPKKAESFLSRVFPQAVKAALSCWRLRRGEIRGLRRDRSWLLGLKADGAVIAPGCEEWVAEFAKGSFTTYLAIYL